MKSRASISLAVIAALTLWLTACGGGSPSPTPNGPISVAFVSVPATSLPASSTAPLAVVVNNDINDAGASWTVTCGSQACGTFNPAATPSNSPTTYTTPSAIPTGNVVTITATSVADSTKSVSAKITITTAPPSPLADGSYVFHLAGEDAGGSSPYYLAGVFTVNHGGISGGEQDYVDSANGATDTLIASRCSLGTTNSGNIQITLATGDPNVGVNGVETLHGTRVSSSRLLIAEFDTSASASGSLDLQTSKSAPSGGYAFNLSGLDGNAEANALVMGGILDITGNSISLNNSVLDYNDGGSVGQKQSFSSGVVSAPDSFGRITIPLTPSPESRAPEFGLSGYIVGANRIELVEDLNDALNGTLGGTALGQGSKTGTFTPSVVMGTTYVFTAIGADVNGLATFAGGFALNADGTLGGWVQPWPDHPFIPIRADSSWSTETHLGFEYAVLLVDPSYRPPPTMDVEPTQGGSVVQVTIVKGTGTPTFAPTKPLKFSGYDWSLRTIASDRGGTNNLYDPDNAWTDSSGALHMRITKKSGRWVCAQLALNRSLGYGTYVLVIRDVSHLQPAEVLSMYTFDEWHGDEYYREMDLEISRWGDAANKNNAQYGIQPFYIPGNVFPFKAMPGTLTYSMRWEPGRADFETVRGASSFHGGAVVAQHEFTSGVPSPGQEKVKLEFYVVASDKYPLQKDDEVVLDKFEYLP